MGRNKKYATDEERREAQKKRALEYYYANRQLKNPENNGKGISYTPEYHQNYAREYYRRKTGKTSPETGSILVSPSECS